MPSHRALHLASLALLATAASTTPLAKRATFSLEQVSVGQVLKNGPADMARVYAKYSSQAVPSNVTAAAAAIQSGQVTATPESYDEAYLAPVTVGGQTLNMDFDTGSSDFWVFSTELPSSESAGHTLYNPADSSTATLLSGYTWSIEYEDDSSSSGNVYLDTVSIGGVTATSQAVEAAETVSTEFVEDTANDGLVGLAFDSINTVRPVAQETFFDNVKSSLASPLFTATLKHDTPGYYDFGYIDDTKYTGSITYTSISTANGVWEFTASGYAVGSGAVTSSTYSAIADTGTTLLYLPQAAVTAYYDQVSGAAYNREYEAYTVPCTATLPSFTAVINGYEAVVPGTYMNYQPLTSSTCYGGIQPNTGLEFAVFGDVFLKSQFVVFDNPGTPQIGFAAQA